MKKRLILLITVMIMIIGCIPSYAEGEEEQPEKILDPLQFEASVAGKGTDYIYLSWTETGAEEYQVYQYYSGGYHLIYSAKSNYYWVDDLKPGGKYSFKITDGNSSTKVSEVTVPERPRSVEEKNLYGKKAKISWNYYGYKTGFQVRYSKKKSFSSYSTVYVKSSKAYLKKLKKNTKYYVKVRAYKDSDGKRYYGSWSGISSFTYHALKKTEGRTYMDGILIVNKTYSIPSKYSPGLRKTVKSAYSRMEDAAAEKGVTIWIGSGYRSYSYQKSLYNYYLSYDSKKNVDQYAARPGHSEHQSGYAIDLNTAGTSFGGTKADKWVKKNCYKYGFIIRYPDGKSKITGYMYEPWHLRYVGEELAKELYNDGDWITLEEHFGITSKYK